MVCVLVARFTDTSGQPSTLGSSTRPPGPSSAWKFSALAIVTMPAADQRRSGCMSPNSRRAPPLASSRDRYPMSASSTGLIRSQCGAISRSWQSRSSSASRFSVVSGAVSSSAAASGQPARPKIRRRLARTAAAGVPASRSSSSPKSGQRAVGAGSRNSGVGLRSRFSSGHTSPARSGWPASSRTAQSSHGRFTAPLTCAAPLACAPSSRTAASVSPSADVANRVPARSATDKVISMAIKHNPKTLGS